MADRFRKTCVTRRQICGAINATFYEHGDLDSMRIPSDPEGRGGAAAAKARQKSLETNPHCVQGLFRDLVESSKRIFNGQELQWATNLIEGYRQGYICLLVDLNVRELGDEKPCEYTAVFYRQGRDAGIKWEPHALRVDDDLTCPKHGWNDNPMLVGYREPVQGAQIMTVPTLIWLYPRFEYVDKILGKLWFFRSLCDSLSKAILIYSAFARSP